MHTHKCTCALPSNDVRLIAIPDFPCVEEGGGGGGGGIFPGGKGERGGGGRRGRRRGGAVKKKKKQTHLTHTVQSLETTPYDRHIT